MRPLIIGFAGLPQAGKTTAAQAIAAEINARSGGPNAVVHPVFEPVKSALEFMGISKQENPDLYRPLAYAMGDTIRAADSNYFARVFEYWMEVETEDQIILVDDVRMPQEWDLCDYVYLVDREPGDWTGSALMNTELDDAPESERQAMLELRQPLSAVRSDRILRNDAPDWKGWTLEACRECVTEILALHQQHTQPTEGESNAGHRCIHRGPVHP